MELPPDLTAAIDRLVAAGRYGSRDEAVADLVRRGLERIREPVPGRRPSPPGVGEPSDDQPTSIRPDDVNWM